MHRVMVWFFALSCVFYAAVTTWVAFALPEGPIPTHWSGFGSVPADGWSSRGGAIATLVILGTSVATLFTVILAVLSRSKTLAGLNIPHKDYWIRPENLPDSRRRALTDMGLFSGVMMLWLSTVGIAMAQAARDPQGRSSGWEGIAFAIWLLATLGWTVWMVTRRWVPPEHRG